MEWANLKMMYVLLNFNSTGHNCLEFRSTEDLYKEGIFHRQFCLELLMHCDNKWMDLQLALLLFQNSVPLCSLNSCTPGTQFPGPALGTTLLPTDADPQICITIASSVLTTSPWLLQTDKNHSCLLLEILHDLRILGFPPPFLFTRENTNAS